MGHTKRFQAIHTLWPTRIENALDHCAILEGSFIKGSSTNYCTEYPAGIQARAYAVSSNEFWNLIES
jgi:hypothetical protein